MSIITDIISRIELPQMAPASQKFDSQHVDDPRAELRYRLREKGINRTLRPGMKVAITAGSRGIRNIPILLQTLVSEVKAAGAVPFLVPAMGSHGGATAKGQKEMLKGLGITEESMGCPICSSMEVVKIGKTADGKDVFLDSNAAHADGIIVMNRVKAHTSFTGQYESGLLKMMSVGLGKQVGAQACHREGHGKMAEYVKEFGTAVLKNANILFGVAILENAYDETRRLEVLFPGEFLDREPELLAEAKAHMPKIHLTDLDVLIVDRMGKDISGLGMDPHVTGSFVSEYARGPKRPGSIAVLDMTEAAHGNGTGIGVADVTTERLYRKIDFEATYANVMTACMPAAARVPLVMKNQKQAVQAAIQVSRCADRKKIRVVRISDTLHLEKIWVSEALLEEVDGHPQMTVLGEKSPLAFNGSGDLF
ncbi:lactate racemase domain-containing protein [Clostridium sp. Marseille-P3244]|uniref:lactate racemase domain-containing protein n=1 Tax=Clostridium sp. Marseille-P3244 TaxID=1871020 RepID=UPI0009307B3F|nr:lactate racemase domain-containing protein [Clostridium sp. Marseille-P3244]